MTDDLIIDHSKSLSWKQRLFTHGATGVLWVLWIKTCVVGLIVWLHNHFIGIYTVLDAMQLLLEVTVIVWVLQFIFPKQKRIEPKVILPKELEFPEYKDSKVVIVHHDEFGNIIKVEKK